MGTSTSRFGVGKREGHDATDFYARFRPPEVSADAEVVGFTPDPPLICCRRRLHRRRPVWQAIGRASLMPGPVLLLT